MRTRARVAFLILLTVGGILPISLILTAPSAHGMVRFSSYQDLEHFLLTRSQCGPGYLPQYGRQVDLYGQPALGPALPASRNTLGSASQSSSSVSSAPSHSETNNRWNFSKRESPCHRERGSKNCVQHVWGMRNQYIRRWIDEVRLSHILRRTYPSPSSEYLDLCLRPYHPLQSFTSDDGYRQRDIYWSPPDRNLCLPSN